MMLIFLFSLYTHNKVKTLASKKNVKYSLPSLPKGQGNRNVI